MTLYETPEDLWRRAASGDAQAAATIKTALENAVSVLAERWAGRRAAEPTMDQIRATAAALGRGGAEAYGHTQHDRDYEKMVGARREPVAAEVIARAAAGRANCCRVPGLLANALAGKHPDARARISLWLTCEPGQDQSIFELVYTLAEAWPGQWPIEVKVYAAYYHIWQKAKLLEDHDDPYFPKFLDSDAVEEIFGLRI